MWRGLELGLGAAPAEVGDAAVGEGEGEVLARGGGGQRRLLVRRRRVVAHLMVI